MPSRFMTDPFLCLAFLTEVITTTISAQNNNENIDIFKIISDAIGGRMGLLINADELKNLVS